MVLGIAIGAAFDKVGLGLALGIVFGAAFAGMASRQEPPTANSLDSPPQGLRRASY